MVKMARQGTILLERDEGEFVLGEPIPRARDGAVVVFEDQYSGHRHVLYDSNVTFQPVITHMTRKLSSETYLGHLIISGKTAELIHKKHAPITLDEGIYCVRRQRHYEVKEHRLVID